MQLNTNLLIVKRLNSYLFTVFKNHTIPTALLQYLSTTKT